MREEQIVCPPNSHLEFTPDVQPESGAVQIIFPGVEGPLFDMRNLEPGTIVIAGVIKTTEELERRVRMNVLSDLEESEGLRYLGRLPNESAIGLDSSILSTDGQHRRLQLVGIDAHIVPGGLVIVQNRTIDPKRASEFESLFGRPIRRIMYRELQTNITGEVVVYQKLSLA